MTFRRSSVSHSMRRIRRRFQALSRRDQGVALLEFALVAPVMIAMYLGMVELSLAVGHDRKNTLVARTIADLVTQSQTVSNSGMDAIFTSTAAILAPYPLADVTLRVSSLRVDNNAKVWVVWSDTKNFNRSTGTFSPLTRCMDGAAIIPAPLRTKGMSIVVAESKITHTPVTGQYVGTFDMEEKSYFRPRLSTEVAREGTPTTLCPGEVAVP